MVCRDSAAFLRRGRGLIGLDRYSVPARLFPAVLVVLPLGLAVAALFPQDLIVWGTGSGLVTTTGLAFLMAERARRPGRRLQDRMDKRLGARPTTILLRHSDTRLNADVKRRYHRCLEDVVPDVRLPTPREETEDPETADQIYDSCTTYMLERTRDREAFPLVFKELVSYGMVRNLTAMKPGAIGSAAVGTLVCAVAALWNGLADIDPVAATAGIISMWLLVFWIFRLNEKWVEDAAFDYARRLLASCDRIKATE